MWLGLQRGVRHLGHAAADALQQQAGQQAARHHEDPGVVERGDRGGTGGGAENGDEARHAECDADLAAHDVQRRAGGEALGWQRRRGRTAERGQHEAHADPTEQAARQVVARPVGHGADVGDPEEPRAGKEHSAHGADGPVPEAGAQEPAGERGDPGQQRPGGDHEPCPQHGLVPEAREEQHATQHEGPETAEEGQRAEIGQRNGAVADHRRLNDGVGVPEGAHDQPGAGDDGHREGADDPPAGPAPVRAFDDGGDQAGHGDGQQDGPEEVGLVRIGVTDLLERAHAEHERHHGEGQVDEEDPAPAGLDQQAADRRAERSGRTADGGPQADRRTLAGGTERRQQQAERGGQHQGAADRLQHAGADQELEGRGDGTEGGRRGEDGQSEQEGPLAAGPVGPTAGRHQDGGEDDGVGAEHPRQRAQALAVVRGRDAGEGDVDDEQVERREEHARQDDQGGQDRPGALDRGRCALQSVLS